MSHLLSESPVQVYSALHKLIDGDDFSANTALLFLGIITFTAKMHVLSDDARKTLAQATSKETIKDLKKVLQQIDSDERSLFIDRFTKDSKPKILRDLANFERKLLNFYDESNIPRS